MIKRIYYRKRYFQDLIKKNFFLFLKFFLFVLFGLFIIGISLFIYFAKDLPRPESFTERQLTLPTKIYDRSGEILLYQIYGEEKREIVSLEEIPQYLIDAVIIAEDANFYNHFGLDWKGILRAALVNLKLWKPIQGASTISQQLIRSSFLTREKTFKRKIREIVLTLELERRYSKDQILEWYLNQVPFGANSYGVEAASQTYFKKSVSEVSLAEAVILASLIRAPSYLSPYGPNRQELLDRKDYILDKMVRAGLVSKEKSEIAKKEEISFSKILQSIKAPHFVLFVRDYLVKKYGEDYLKENGLKVYTTLDFELQQLAEKTIEKYAKINRNSRAYNASLVAISPKTGEILAMVGSANWYATSSYPEGCEILERNCLFDPKFNIATLGKRQPGSAFKPFAYAMAFKKGYTPETILWDVKTEFNSNCSFLGNEEKDKYGLDCYHPKNYDEKFRGPVNFRQALAQSINVPSIKVLYLAGLEETIELAKSFGIATLNKPPSWYGLPLVLGGGEVKLLEMTSAYGVFATEGYKVSPFTVLKIEDSRGNIIEDNKKTPKKILETQVARLINDILSDNEARAPLFGYRSPLYLSGYQVAVKTGTTQEYKDAWTIGYTPSLVAGVWAGNNDSSPTDKKPGVVLAAPIWHEFMKEALKNFPLEKFEKPKAVEIKKPILNGIIDLENPHSVLYYLQKDDPQGETPEDPSIDPQYRNWEKGISLWLLENKKFLKNF